MTYTPENHNAQIGTLGEDKAVEHLQSLGMEVLDRNWRKGGKELDIIALEGSTLRIIEVKSRTIDAKESIQSSLNDKKLRNITKGALLYSSSYCSTAFDDIYFDLITVIFAPDGSYELEYTPKFFYPQW